MGGMPTSEHDRPRARTALDDIPAYRAGRSVVGPDGVALAKLSSNELPFPPFPEVVDAIARASADANRSPSPSPPAAVVDSSAGCRAPGDPDMGPAGVTSASGSVRCCLSV